MSRMSDLDIDRQEGRMVVPVNGTDTANVFVLSDGGIALHGNITREQARRLVVQLSSFVPRDTTNLQWDGDEWYDTEGNDHNVEMTCDWWAQLPDARTGGCLKERNHSGHHEGPFGDDLVWWTGGQKGWDDEGVQAITILHHVLGTVRTVLPAAYLP